MKLTKAQRAELKQKFGGHCAYCGELLGDKWHADHIDPIRRNWRENTSVHPERDVIENLNPACAPCNINKHSCSLEGFRKQIEHYRDVQLLRDSGTARHLIRFGLIEIKPNPVIFYFERCEVRNG